MKLYARRIDKQCIEKQISIKKSILKDFFDEAKDQDIVKIVGVLSKYSGNVSILTSTDPRLGGDIKKIIYAEEKELSRKYYNYKVGINDILLFFYIEEKSYRLEIIAKDDERYKSYASLLDDPNFKTRATRQNLHLLTLLDDSIQTSSTTNDIVAMEDIRVSGANNIILYGVPGSGKSHTLQNTYCENNNVVQKITFHPDYSYGDFVGQIMPILENGVVSYSFIPGPFTNILKKAYHNPQTKHILVIDEINRGNAPAIFGEIFQLLDRLKIDKDGLKKGTSEYSINNADIANIVYENKETAVRIPSNLWIVATMNTSDQNVFTLDTAFQRRFAMQLIENSFDNVDEGFKNKRILNTDISWQKFCSTINNFIAQNNVGLSSIEDKRLGVYFVSHDDLQTKKTFAYKVIKYLWDDAFKFDREAIFNTTKFNTLEAIVKHFTEKSGEAQFDIFNNAIKDELYDI